MLINDKNYSNPFVLSCSIKERIKTILFDFYMFLQVVLLFTLCLFIELPLLLVDKVCKKNFMGGFMKFIVFIANL